MNCILLEQYDFTDESLSHVRLTGRRREHVVSVCRAKCGEELRVGIVGGLMGKGIVTVLNDSVVEMNVVCNENPPEPLPVTLFIALPRPKSLRKAIETATTLGVKRITIMESWRVEKSYWSSPLLYPQNLRIHMIHALEQARDTILPQIMVRRRFKPFVEDEIPDLITGTRALLSHPYDSPPCPHEIGVPTVVAIGPEGGFIPYEVDLLKQQGFEPVSLGERILRVEQAIPVLLGKLY